jgi:hypothetical protein
LVQSSPSLNPYKGVGPLIDIKIIEFATRITEKAMGTESSAATWINAEDKVSQFLKTMVKTLDDLYNEQPPRADQCVEISILTVAENISSARSTKALL